MGNGYTVFNLAKDVQKKIHGGKIHDLVGSLDEGRRQMLMNIRPPEMVRSSYLEDGVYDKVDQYAVARDLRYENIIEIWKLSAYRNVDTMEHPLEMVFQSQFGQKRRGSRNVLSIAYLNGTKYASIYHPKGLKRHQQTIINKANSLNENGTWNVGGNVVNLRLDSMDHITKKASIEFDFNNSATTGFINNLTMQSVDISHFFEKGAEFTWFNIPLPQNVLSVELILGSDNTNLTTDFYSATVNQPHDNNQFITGWNLLKFNLTDFIMTGTPNPKAINWLQLNFTTTGQAVPNCNIDSFILREGEIFWYRYNSRYCLIDNVTQAWKQFTTANSDIIPLEEDSYQILMLETALIEQSYLYANNFGAETDITSIQSKLNDAYTVYKLNHTDEAVVPEESSYTGGDMYQGYTSDPENDSRYGDQDNYGDEYDNTSNNNNWPI